MSSTIIIINSVMFFLIAIMLMIVQTLIKKNDNIKTMLEHERNRSASLKLQLKQAESLLAITRKALNDAKTTED